MLMSISASVPVFAGSQNRQAILILAMHRSGSSALTRILGLCGAALPTDPLPATTSNPRGHWEPHSIVNLHAELLDSVGCRWDDVAVFPRSWFHSRQAESFKQRLVSALRVEFEEARLPVIKDPRICRLVPLWKSVLAEYGAHPRAVILVRNPLEVADSLESRNRFGFGKALKLWLRHFIEAERDTRSIKRCFVSYEEVLNDWRSVVDRIANDLDLERYLKSDFREKEILAFLSSELRHHSYSAATLNARGDIPYAIKAAYKWAEGACNNPRSNFQVLDRINAALAAKDVTLMPWHAGHRLLRRLRGRMASRT